MLGAAGIPDRFQDRTLGSFDTTEPGQRQALEFAEASPLSLPAALCRCAVFFGNAGTGRRIWFAGGTAHYAQVQPHRGFHQRQRWPPDPRGKVIQC